MGKTFYVADVHFGHRNVLSKRTNPRSFEDRPFGTLEEMEKGMTEIWNSRVTNGDNVYVLGDLCWRDGAEAARVVSALKGNLHLIKGNHDRMDDLRYSRLFVEIADYKEIRDRDHGTDRNVVLSHYPIAAWNRQRMVRRTGEVDRNYAIHLYGHVHASDDDWCFREYLKRTVEERRLYCEAYNVGACAPYMGYGPRTLDEILDAARTDAIRAILAAGKAEGPIETLRAPSESGKTE